MFQSTFAKYYQIEMSITLYMIEKDNGIMMLFSETEQATGLGGDPADVHVSGHVEHRVVGAAFGRPQPRLGGGQLEAQVGAAEGVEETGLLTHIEDLPSEVGPLVGFQEHMGLDRVTPSGEMGVLDDPVAVQVLFDDGGVSPELGHEAEANAGRDVGIGIGRAALTARLRPLLRQEGEAGAARADRAGRRDGRGQQRTPLPDAE